MSRCASPPDKRRYRLTERQVVQADRLQRTQSPQHGGIVRKEFHRFGDRHFQNVRHGLAGAVTPGQFHFQDFLPEPPPAAGPAAQVHVAEKLHLDMLEALSGAVRAPAVARVEAEGAGRIAAFPGQGLCRQPLAHHIQRTDEAGGVGSGGAPDGRLIHRHDVVDEFVAADSGMGSCGALPVPLSLASAL